MRPRWQVTKRLMSRGDHQALIASIRECLFPLGDNIYFRPGHGPMLSFGWKQSRINDLAVGLG